MYIAYRSLEEPAQFTYGGITISKELCSYLVLAAWIAGLSLIMLSFLGFSKYYRPPKVSIHDLTNAQRKLLGLKLHDEGVLCRFGLGFMI